MSNLLSKGYHIFADNFFTSVILVKYLYSKLTIFTGTIRQNITGIPDVMKRKFNVGKLDMQEKMIHEKMIQDDTRKDDTCCR